jgi:hypothetical protein
MSNATSSTQSIELVIPDEYRDDPYTPTPEQLAWLSQTVEVQQRGQDFVDQCSKSITAPIRITFVSLMDFYDVRSIEEALKESGISSDDFAKELDLE